MEKMKMFSSNLEEMFYQIVGNSNWCMMEDYFRFYELGLIIYREIDDEIVELYHD